MWILQITLIKIWRCVTARIKPWLAILKFIFIHTSIAKLTLDLSFVCSNKIMSSWFLFTFIITTLIIFILSLIFVTWNHRLKCSRNCFNVLSQNIVRTLIFVKFLRTQTVKTVKIFLGFTQLCWWRHSRKDFFDMVLDILCPINFMYT